MTQIEEGSKVRDRLYRTTVFVQDLDLPTRFLRFNARFIVKNLRRVSQPGRSSGRISSHSFTLLFLDLFKGRALGDRKFGLIDTPECR
jgi:hypothetical protein